MGGWGVWGYYEEYFENFLEEFFHNIGQNVLFLKFSWVTLVVELQGKSVTALCGWLKKRGMWRQQKKWVVLLGEKWEAV